MFIGIDIGGTKCAVVKASVGCDGAVKIVGKRRFETEDAAGTLDKIFEAVESFMPCEAIGISCGGPLDEEIGVILSPPNLPGWENTEIVKMMKERFCVPTRLLNDANACALAEWSFGAGRGTENMVFLTFGTGLGAGLILNGRLYSGTNGNAGEVGHIRLEPTGPVGYGKAGSFEGFCSGGGIKRLAENFRAEAEKSGKTVFEGGCDAAHLAALARGGDRDAMAIFDRSAEMLGRGLSVIIDMLNPEKIVIGSIFQRAEDLFRPTVEHVVKDEALAQSKSVCEIVPAMLGDEIGDFAAVAVAKIAALEAKKERCEHKLEFKYCNELAQRYPNLASCVEDVKEAVTAIVDSYCNGGKILLCGNGGSAADCEHISGELLKGFLMRRTPRDADLALLKEALGDSAMKLQCGIPAVPLTSLSASLSAFANDVDPELVYAQLVFALGKKEDTVICISTSGNSKNAVAAAKCAKALGITTVALVGAGGGALAEICDTVIKVPETETYKIQEYHLPVYHALCADAEAAVFDK